MDETGDVKKGMLVVLVVMIMALVAVVVSQSPPSIGSYTVDAFMNATGSNIPITMYADNTHQLYRNQVFTGVIMTNILQEYDIEYDTNIPNVCNTTCFKTSVCGNPSIPCGVESWDLFGAHSPLPLTKKVGLCSGGNMWNVTYGSIVESYCISASNIPISLIVCNEGVGCSEFVFKNFVAGIPDSSLFVPPAYCPCINSTSAIIHPPRSTPSLFEVHNAMTAILRVAEKHV